MLAGADLATEVLEASLANSNATVQQLQEQVNIMEATHSTDMKALSQQFATANTSLAIQEATIRYGSILCLTMQAMSYRMPQPPADSAP